MSFTNDVLLRTLQFLKHLDGGIQNKSFLMLGKQEMHLHEAFLDVLFESGIIDDKTKFGENELEDSVEFFKAFGFKEVHALDVSDYEGADIIFNLNDDLPENLFEKFDIVFDGGCIEHVFDIAKALSNMVKLAKKGGYIFNTNNPVYNYVHNTFYNISPMMFLDFYSANKHSVIDCSLITYLAEDIETRAWADRPVIWSPDVRLMNFVEPYYTGKHIRSLNKLCSNPHPHTYIITQKKHSEEIIYPIISCYAKRYVGEAEDNSHKTSKVRLKLKYDMSKVIQFIKNRENISLYCAGHVCEMLLKELYEKSFETCISEIFDSDVSKIGAGIMGKKINYLNSNTYTLNEDILICSEKYSEEVYKELCMKGISKEKIYKISDFV